MILAFHNHMQYATEEWSAGPDKALAVSPKIMLNFDMGHYFGSTGKHPLDFINNNMIAIGSQKSARVNTCILSDI